MKENKVIRKQNWDRLFFSIPRIRKAKIETTRRKF